MSVNVCNKTIIKINTKHKPAQGRQIRNEKFLSDVYTHRSRSYFGAVVVVAIPETAFACRPCNIIKIRITPAYAYIRIRNPIFPYIAGIHYCCHGHRHRLPVLIGCKYKQKLIRRQHQYRESPFQRQCLVVRKRPSRKVYRAFTGIV